MLASSAFILLTGKIYTLYSPKWVLIGAIEVSEVGSVVCYAALSLIAFIVGRAVAGLGSSGIFTGGPVSLAQIVPLSK